MVSGMSRISTVVAVLSLFAGVGGCAHDHREAAAGPVKLSADREPFTFSSWDISKVEWTATAKAPQPPDVSAVMADGTVLPLRGLTPGQVRPKAEPSTRPTSGDSFDASGFHFDFTGDRLTHFVAAPITKPDGSTVQPVFQNHGGDDRDVNDDVRQYPLPLDHDTCVHLFGGADGMDTQLALPAVLPF